MVQILIKEYLSSGDYSIEFSLDFLVLFSLSLIHSRMDSRRKRQCLPTLNQTGFCLEQICKEYNKMIGLQNYYFVLLCTLENMRGGSDDHWPANQTGS